MGEVKNTAVSRAGQGSTLGIVSHLFSIGRKRDTIWGVVRPWQYKPRWQAGECSRCENPRAKGGRYCVECRRAYQKAWHRKRKAQGLE